MSQNFSRFNNLFPAELPPASAGARQADAVPNDELLRAVVDTVRESMLLLDNELRVVLVSRSFCDTFRVSAAEMSGKPIYELGEGEWNIPELRTLLSDILPQRTTVEDFSVVSDFPQIGVKHMLLNARTLRLRAPGPGLVLLAIEDITERQAAQRAVQASQQLLQATLASIGDGVITTDAAGAVLSLNGAAETLTGWSQKDARGKPLPHVFKILNENTQEAVPNPALRVLAEGRIVGLANHTLLIDKAGTVRAIDDSAAPILDSEGRVAGSVLVFRDISQQRAAEREKERLQKNQSALLASTMEGVYTTDRQGNCTLINQAALQLLQFSEQECLGQNMHELIHHRRPDGTALPEAECKIFQALRAGTPLKAFNESFWRKDGSILPVSASVAPIVMAGITTGAVIAFSDRTERDRLDQDRQEASDRLRLAMEAARIVSWTWRPEQNEISTSDNLAAIYGISSIQSMGAGMELVAPEDRERHRSTVSQAAAQRTGYRSEFRLQRPDTRQVVWLDERCVCTKAGDPPVFSFSGVTMDITEKRLNQQMLEEAHHKLEKTTAELRRSNEDLGQFATIAGHDLQSPLRTISSYTQLLLRRLEPRLDDQTREYAGFITEAVVQMSSLITSLLDFARVGGADPIASTFELRDAIQETLNAVRIEIAESNAAISIEPLPAVTGSESQLRQLFQNLLLNAIKYRHPERAPDIRVGVTDEGKQWKFFVSDNGLGIAEAYLETIFNPFQRLHGAERPGTGLGLALCRRIAGNHGGELWVNSVMGEGSTFYFRLPKNGVGVVG